MKKIERAFALLLTLVMLLTTFGIAEEAGAVDFAPEAIAASEQPADSVEEPAEEPIEEPVAEEPVEEAAEEPAEEPAEPVAEEAAEAAPGDSLDAEVFGYIEKPCPAVESEGYHSFENGKCTACGYKCPHGRVNTMYGLDVVSDNGVEAVVNDMDPVFSPIDGEKHLVTMRYRYVVTQCQDCFKILKKTKQKKETTYAVEAPHVFGDGVRCYMCGYRNDAECAHENYTTEAHEVIDGYEKIDGVKHLVKGTNYPNAKKCLDCGAFFDNGEGEAFTREEPHIKRQFVQEYDDYFDYGYVGWDGSNGYERPYDIEIHCEACGYNYPTDETTHTHVWVDCTEEWDERCTPIANDFENHTRVVDIYTGKQCSICGIHLKMQKTKEETKKEPHVWNSGFCMKCGMSQTCVHPKEIDDGLYTADEVKAMGLLDEAAADTFAPLSDECHMVSSTLYRVYVCDYCCVPLRYEFASSEDVKVEGHEWKNGKCTLCGYVCKHESKYTDFYGEATYSQKKDKKGNVDKNVHTATPKQEAYMEQFCTNCGKSYINYKKIKKAFDEAHTFVKDGDKVVCSKCGYVDECAHANARIVPDVNFYAAEIVNTGDPENHAVDGTYSVHKMCPDCGYVFEDSIVDYSDGTAPHMFNNDGICQLCGYAKADAKAIALSIQKAKDLAVGETWAPALNIAPKTATGVTYATSSAKIFDVDPATGKVTAKKAGKAKLTVSCGSLKAVCTVTVKKPAESIALPAERTLGIGQRITLTATLAPKKTFVNLSYASDNDSCVKVVDAATGEIAAIAAGTANITATALDGKLTAKCAVTVTEAPKSISLGNLPKQLGKGEKLTIEPKLLDATGKETVGYVRFMSSNAKVVKVGEYDGKVTAAGIGTAKIYAFAYNGVQCAVDVEVKKAPKGIILTPATTSVTLKPAETYTVKAEITADTASQLTWSSSSEQIAKVEPTENPGEFKITAVAAGKAKITISTFNKKKKIITVTVAN